MGLCSILSRNATAVVVFGPSGWTARTKHPVGAPFAVQHFHRAGLSLTHVVPGQRALTVAKDKIIITAAERKGNVWLARF